MSKTLIEKTDDIASLIARIKNPRCSICLKTGRLHQETNLFIKGLETHHVLEKSTYPSLRFDPMNHLVLDDRHHLGNNLFPKSEEEYIFAHMEPEREPENDLIIIPNRFDRWLQRIEQDKWNWKEANKHRKHEELRERLEDIFVRLTHELKELINTEWMNDSQVDPRQLKGQTKRIE